MKIEKINARLILNSQGNKAIECFVLLDNGKTGVFAPPAGTSVGKYEARTVKPEIALEQIKKLTPEIIKMNDLTQESLDEFLVRDEQSGANSTLALSIAYAVAADTLKKRFPCQGKPQMMVLFFEGGVHASNKVSFQEFLCIYDDIFAAAADFKKMKTKLEESGHFINFGMEGALVSENLSDEIIFDLMDGQKIGLDIGGNYLEGSKIEMMALPEKYKIVSIEDHFPEDEVEKWREFYKKWGNQLIIVGDDLTVTNKKRIQEFANNAINAVIIKPNQQRTLTDTLEAVATAKKENLKTIVSHRSGETNQSFVSDLAVAIAADFVKFGAPVRGERVEKYNKLLALTNPF